MGDSASREKIEQELARAKHLGRWLSDEELAAEAQEEAQRLALEEQQRSRRTRLTVLTVVCVLIPPLWPLALALTLYLLFPRTSTRLFFAAGIGAIVVGIGALGLSIGLLIWLLSLLS